MKQIHDLNEEAERARIELSTFKFLLKQEAAAIPRRLEVSVFCIINRFKAKSYGAVVSFTYDSQNILFQR